MVERLTFGLAMAAQSPEEVLEKAVEAERQGLDCLWFFQRRNLAGPGQLAEAVAEVTSKIRLGLGFSPLLQSFEEISAVMASLSRRFGDRFELCLIPGDRKQLVEAGISAERFRRLAETSLEVRKAVESRLKVEGLKCRIWLGAQGPRMLRTARAFEAVLLNMASPRLVKWALKVSGLTPEETRIGVIASAYVYQTFKEEVYCLLRKAAALALLRASKALKSFLRVQEHLEGLEVEEASEKLSNELLKDFSICLEAERLNEFVCSLAELGVSHIVFSHPQDYSVETIRELGLALKKLCRPQLQ